MRGFANHAMRERGRFEAGVAFAAWMYSRRTPTAYTDVMAYFECCAATAQRWLNAWEAATGNVRIRQEGGRKRAACRHLFGADDNGSSCYCCGEPNPNV